MKPWLLIGGVVILSVAPHTFGATPQDLAAGKKLYTGKCARCHKMYDPTRYDDRAWDTWMTKMRDKAKLNDEQYRRLSAYVATLRTSK
jgi:mono/diheme cytochrome c family protein